MSKWTRTNGYDEQGRRTILITENEPSKPQPLNKIPWFVKLDWKIMKIMFWGALITTGIIGVFGRILSGVPF